MGLEAAKVRVSSSRGEGGDGMARMQRAGTLGRAGVRMCRHGGAVAGRQGEDMGEQAAGGESGGEDSWQEARCEGRRCKP